MSKQTERQASKVVDCWLSQTREQGTRNKEQGTWCGGHAARVDGEPGYLDYLAQVSKNGVMETWMRHGKNGRGRLSLASVRAAMTSRRAVRPTLRQTSPWLFTVPKHGHAILVLRRREWAACCALCFAHNHGQRASAALSSPLLSLSLSTPTRPARY